MFESLRLPLKLALRNVLRQRRRSAFAVASVAFGVAALLIAAGFIQWVFWAMREDTIGSRLGHVQIVRHGYFQEGAADPFKYLLRDDLDARKGIANLPAVRSLAPRLHFAGLIAAGDTTISFIGEGIAPTQEAAFNRAFVIETGVGLSDAEPRGVVIGRGLAENLGVKPGDSITLLANTKAGGVNGADARVLGTFSTVTKAYDDAAIRMPIGLARELTRTTGSHAWVLLLDKTESTDEVVAAVRARLPAAEFDIVPWHDLADFYKKTVVLFSKQVGVIKIIIGIIIILSILNTLTTTVMERTGEIGTAMALGSRRRDILLQFVLEGLLLGALGGLVGLVAGWIIASAVSAVGIPMPPPPGMSRGVIGEIRLSAGLSFDAFVLAAVTTLAASIYPAWRASRLQVVDALRHNR